MYGEVVDITEGKIQKMSNKDLVEYHLYNRTDKVKGEKGESQERLINTLLFGFVVITLP